MTRGVLEGRGAVVTGGGRGIGAAVAQALAGAGAAVVVAARTPSAVEQVAATLAARGARACAVASDVTDEGSVKALFDEARRRLGAIDILVNNAGASSGSPLAKITLAEWRRLLDANATATFLCTREVAPEMVARRWGRVINVASIAGLEGARNIAHYSAAKHAVVGFTRAVAFELEGTGVTINAVCPGYVDTPMTDENLARLQSRRGLSRDEALAAFLATTGQDRLIRPEEVAAEVLALCGDDAARVNGRALLVGVGLRTA